MSTVFTTINNSLLCLTLFTSVKFAYLVRVACQMEVLRFSVVYSINAYRSGHSMVNACCSFSGC